MRRTPGLQRFGRQLATLLLVFGALLLAGIVGYDAGEEPHDCCPELASLDDEGEDCCDSDFGRCCVGTHITVPASPPEPLDAPGVRVDPPSPPPAPRLIARNVGPPPTPPPIGIRTAQARG